MQAADRVRKRRGLVLVASTEALECDVPATTMCRRVAPHASLIQRPRR